MMIRKIGISLLALLLVVDSNTPSMAQAPAPPPPPPTLWNFLGIPQGVRKVNGSLINRRGNFPGLEQKPPMLPIAHPDNLASEVPALKAAAEIKQAEDLKKQKIKAIKYLASIGCGCYDKDGKITTALIESMANDCTEEVRLEAVQAVSEAAQGGCCENCGSTCCCNNKIVEALSQIAYERDDNGCYLEPSERVREAAVEALRACCPNRGPIRAEEVPEIEGGEDQNMIEGAETPPPPPPPTETEYRSVPAPQAPTSARRTAPANRHAESRPVAPTPRVSRTVAPTPRVAQPTAPTPRVAQPTAPTPRVAQPTPETQPRVGRLEIRRPEIKPTVTEPSSPRVVDDQKGFVTGGTSPYSTAMRARLSSVAIPVVHRSVTEVTEWPEMSSANPYVAEAETATETLPPGRKSSRRRYRLTDADTAPSHRTVSAEVESSRRNTGLVVAGGSGEYR